MSDPPSLHLKKELTQIRKAARLLRDPGTTSSWKSTSRSVLPPASTSTFFTNHFNAGHHPPPDLELPNAKHSAVFLHNWKHQNHKSNHQFDDDAHVDAASSSWVQDESLSDARNGADSKSDNYIPTLALLPSNSGAAMQILSLQDSCLAPGKRVREILLLLLLVLILGTIIVILLAMLALGMPPLLHSTMVMMRSGCSISLPDTLLRGKGTSILCGTQSVYTGHRRSTSLSKKRSTQPHPHAQPLLPLLTGSGGGGRGGSSLVIY
ncbi:hypothetical protein SLEP1_g40270 [Rubroshorea leprosula]|uniref:Uncharacterized protein n=1 Tax=Rubroshorea leprosula TaxID=152421 RepID=A0AAV5L3A4_9ROSI|nr:hypothetical protein SLEP1_g40270 [Rubroshorea leprosula]